MLFAPQSRASVSKGSNLRAFAHAELIAIPILASLFLWKGMWAGWRSLETDFGQYYMGARLLLEHSPIDRIYDWVWLQRAANAHGVSHQLVGYLGLTPFSVFPLLPVAALPVLQAKHIWMLLNAALLIGVIWLLSSATGLSLRRTWLIALLAVIPLRNNFVFGQMHVVILALLASGWYFHVRGKQVASGCCIALAGALKIYPLFYCFYFLLKKRWRALGAVLVVSAGCIGLCWAILGGPVTSTYLAQQLPRSLNGESNGLFVAGSTSSAVMFHRIFLFEPEANSHPLISSPLLYAVVYTLWQAILTGIVVSRLRPRFRRDERETVEWCAFLTLLMFLSSAPSTYHFVVMIGTAVPTYAILERIRPRLSWLFLGVYVIACNAQNIAIGARLPAAIAALLVPRLWAGVGLIAIYAVVLSRRWPTGERPANETSRGGVRPNSGNRHMTGSPAFVWGAIAGLWLIGAGKTWNHLRFLNSDNSHKLLEADHAWMRTEPVVTAEGLYYVGMMETNYKVLRNGTPIQPATTGDELSFAVDRDGGRLWIETASSSGPAIKEVMQRNSRSVNCTIWNAESPALSLDDNSLAFIREERGRGSLWIAGSHDCSLQDQPVRVTPADVDVRSLSGAPLGQFVITGLTGQGPAVFLVSRASQPTVLLRPESEVNSAAISGDGQTLILSERINSQLQLISENLNTHAVRQLTAGNCNATAPSWKDASTIVYATDCERGMGLTTLAEVDLRQ